jgi:curved DNA-binding protein CbpA
MASTPRSHYAVLGLSRDFTPEQLKKQYRLLALKYHPDRNRGDEASASDRFKALSEAFETLSSALKRREYDAELDVQRAERGQAAASPPHRDHYTTAGYGAGGPGFGGRGAPHPASTPGASTWRVDGRRAGYERGATTACARVGGRQIWPSRDAGAGHPDVAARVAGRVPHPVHGLDPG